METATMTLVADRLVILRRTSDGPHVVWTAQVYPPGVPRAQGPHDTRSFRKLEQVCFWLCETYGGDDEGEGTSATARA